MSAIRSAEIIIFPGSWHGPARPGAGPIPPTPPLAAPPLAAPPLAEPEPATASEILPQSPAERLRRALAALDDALLQQRQAVAEWRGSLGALRGSVGELGQSLHGYTNALAALNSRVSALGATARRGAE